MAEARRLNRYLAACGLGSRRGVETLVAEGRVAIDGVIADSPGQRVEEGAAVTVDGAPVAPDAHAYVLLNKPRDVVTTVRDTHGRRTVIELVGADRRLFPVGRLDAETTGLLLLTNDGELAARLMHPRHGVEKTYEATVRGAVTGATAGRLAAGI
jgi:23S rRNA pseudouridine2605 synthase